MALWKWIAGAIGIGGVVALRKATKADSDLPRPGEPIVSLSAPFIAQYPTVKEASQGFRPIVVGEKVPVVFSRVIAIPAPPTPAGGIPGVATTRDQFVDSITLTLLGTQGSLGIFRHSGSGGPSLPLIGLKRGDLFFAQGTH